MKEKKISHSKDIPTYPYATGLWSPMGPVQKHVYYPHGVTASSYAPPAQSKEEYRTSLAERIINKIKV